MCIFSSILMFIARACIAAIFILAGIHKFMDISGTAAYMAAKNIPAMPYLYGAAIVEILGGLSLLLGYKIRFGALLLMFFLIPVTYFFHDFWNVQDPAEMQEQLSNFLKNLAIFGGLLYVFCVGGGICSVDTCCKRSVKPPEGQS